MPSHDGDGGNDYIDDSNLGSKNCAFFQLSDCVKLRHYYQECNLYLEALKSTFCDFSSLLICNTNAGLFLILSCKMHSWKQLKIATFLPNFPIRYL